MIEKLVLDFFLDVEVSVERSRRSLRQLCFDRLSNQGEGFGSEYFYGNLCITIVEAQPLALCRANSFLLWRRVGDEALLLQI